MDEITKVVVYTFFAGACIPLGGVLAYFEKIRPSWLEDEFRHTVIAFSGGVLVAAVALVFVPEGIEYVDHPLISTILFLCGGICFFTIEYFLGTRRREKPQFTAMLLDYLPESLALGGAFAIGAVSAPMLALLIGLQNLPEGFNAYRELLTSRQNSQRKILLFMLLIVPIGPIIGVISWMYFRNDPFVVGAVMLFASGGILYLIFQDIAPQSRMRRHWAPPLGAVLGFGFAMLLNNIMIHI